MAKPVGSACNLSCSYCYYRETQPRMMSDAVLEEFVRQYIAMQTTDSVLFTWHGGEPTLRGLDFYRRVVRLQQRYADGRQIDNALQTNGTLLDDEWCRFLRDEGWLVGISIDGPEELHDSLRRTHDGRPTWAVVMRAIDRLRRFGVEWNAMATVNAANVHEPERFYRFFGDIGCQYLQFTPVAEDEAERIGAADWGTFLCAVYDAWVRRDVGRRFVQIFDATLAAWMGVEPGLCAFGQTCGHAAVIEADGTVYACDHFAFKDFRRGNILDTSTSLLAMLHGDEQRRFGLDKREGLPDECRRCQWLFACNGECPRLRTPAGADGRPGRNRLCEGYRRYFQHVAPDMEFMREELLNERPPANVMRRHALGG